MFFVRRTKVLSPIQLLFLQTKTREKSFRYVVLFIEKKLTKMKRETSKKENALLI